MPIVGCASRLTVFSTTTTAASTSMPIAIANPPKLIKLADMLKTRIRINVINAASGKPVVELNGALAAWFSERGLSAQVSVSDESDYATAFVVVETRDRP